MEYLIDYNINLNFPSTLWYKGTRSKNANKQCTMWEGVVVNTTSHSPPQAQVFFHEESKSKQNAFIQVSAGNNNLRKAITTTCPTAKTLHDVLTEHNLTSTAPLKGPDIPSRGKKALKAASKVFRYALTAGLEAVGADAPAVHFKRAQGMKMKGDVQGAAFVAMMATSMVCSTATDYETTDYAFRSSFLPLQPKTQREAMERSDWCQWEEAQCVEITTLFGKGVFELVKRPKNCDEIPCKFGVQAQNGQREPRQLHLQGTALPQR